MYRQKNGADRTERTKKMRTRILTIGTAGMVTALRCGHYPAQGEEVTADKFCMWPGRTRSAFRDRSIKARRRQSALRGRRR